MAGVTYEPAAAVSLPPVTAPRSPTLRRRPMQDLSWFRSSRPKSPAVSEATKALSRPVLGQNLPPARQSQSPTQALSLSRRGFKAPESRVDATPGRGQLVEERETPKLARRATDSVSRVLSSLKRKNTVQGQRCSSDSSGRGKEKYPDQLMPSTADVQNLRRRAYSYNDRHVDTIYQTLLMAGGATSTAAVGYELLASHHHRSPLPPPPPPPKSPRPSGETQRGIESSVSKATARLLMTFPNIASELPSLRNFACTLDHAGIRWYGRIFVGCSCLCFTGTGITLSGSVSGGRASPPPPSPSDLWYSEEPACASLRSLSSTSNRTAKPIAVASEGWQWPTLSFSSTSLAAGNRPESPPGKPCSRSSKPWRKTALKVPFHDITRVSKELTMGLWPNAMTVATRNRQYIFTNFLRRDRAHQCLSEAWQKNLLVAERLPLTPVSSKTAVQRSLPKPFATNCIQRQQPLPLPATHSACESESTICEYQPAPVYQPTALVKGPVRCWQSDEPTPDWHKTSEADLEAATACMMRSLHAVLFLVIFITCCLLSFKDA